MDSNKPKAKKSTAIVGSSKLSKAQSPQEPLNLIQKKNKSKMHSYRLQPIDEDSLKKMLKDINAIRTGKIITETGLIRGLISLGAKTKPEKILKALKDVL